MQLQGMVLWDYVQAPRMHTDIQLQLAVLGYFCS